ncbi:hypothetical protein ACJMK2_028694 [Sinanodonta woodiana]|uniref:Uncharacterized protein n=1 Tax=Sinanodonta woodiana TaxID=1069815 RepID=A0ABD3X9U7_SINWO
MLNLYEKFKLENPEITISKTCFYRLRPPHIILADFANRRTCLCTRHQNMSLKIKALNNLGIRISKNPDVLIKAYDSNKELLKMIEAVEERSIKFFNWKRVQEGNKMRYKELEENMEKEAFIEKFDRELNDFREHAKIVTSQYNEMRRLREHLPENEVVVWIDFAENYGCVSLEEIQSAYWNATSISLHTMVVYCKTGNDTKIQSYVAVSDFFGKCVETGNPDLRVIHYLSDSPTSQYRNKTMFQFVSMHEEEFGIPARPCDGLGASVKRAADNAVKQGKVSIQSASYFLKWAESSMTSGSKVKYFGYTQEEYELFEAVLKERLNPVPVKGTFKIHYIIGSGTNKIYTRNSTCYCEKCRSDISSTTCEGYEFHVLVKGRDNNEAVDEEMIPAAQDENNGEGEASEATYGVDPWVAVL